MYSKKLINMLNSFEGKISVGVSIKCESWWNLDPRYESLKSKNRFVEVCHALNKGDF